MSIAIPYSRILNLGEIKDFGGELTDHHKGTRHSEIMYILFSPT